jgi:protoporphyrinogen oxidase
LNRPFVSPLPDETARRNGLESIGTAVLGGGPAGLTAAYILGLSGQPGAVFEADDVVGGIAKTIQFGGYRFDLGGHRFFTKLRPIERLWADVLGDELTTRRRLSRIYYGGNFFSYPLEARNVVGRLGLAESLLCAASYAAGRARANPNPETFEEWVTARFGKRLYRTFFRSYTEKVWGVPGSEIRSEWAAQRIKNFSFMHALLSVLGLRREHVTTLIDEFRYPRLGPGQMWEGFKDRVERRGVPVHLNRRVVAVTHDGARVDTVVIRDEAGNELEHPVDGVVSSIPLPELVLSLEPGCPAEVAEAARRLRYRDLCLVAVIMQDEEPFPDNWIYIHDPGTRAARVQNFGAWSPDMVVPGTTCLGVEYFCFEGDEMWEMPHDEAVALAADELARIGLIDRSRILDGVKVRVPKAYPMYDGAYREAVAVLRGYLAAFENLEPCGRNGLHRYNNQDHSMWTAILATLNLVADADYDVWSVNTEAAYHEEGETVEALLEVDLV